jgi:hypothetical protein
MADAGPSQRSSQHSSVSYAIVVLSRGLRKLDGRCECLCMLCFRTQIKTRSFPCFRAVSLMGVDAPILKLVGHKQFKRVNPKSDLFEVPL